MRRRFISGLLLITLVFSLLCPSAAAANGVEYTVQVTSSIDGGDIYVDGTFTEQVTPSVITCESGTHNIEVRLPGYSASEQVVSSGGEAFFELFPEVCPSTYESRLDTYTVANAAEFEEALLTAKNRADDRWTVIRFAESCPRIPYPAERIADGIIRLDDTFTNLTIDGRQSGGMVVSPEDVGLYVYGSNIRMVNIDFESRGNKLSLQVREDDKETRRVDVNDVYILGCRFADSFEVGVGNCGSRGFAATGYGGEGTFNVSNLVFSGNTFERTLLFSFAGAGDEDYNVVSGYTVCSNTFTDGGIGLLASDAHSWYVYGYDGSDEPAYCEYNIFENVTISGNSITYTENTPAVYSAIIKMQAANLGNSHSTLQNVMIRNNRSLILGGDKNIHSTVSIGTVSVSDCYEEGKEYNAHVYPGMEHTDYNTVKHVVIKNNDFQLGSGRSMQIFNVDVNVGGQCGSHNELCDVLVDNNRIESASGVSILNYQGTYESDTCADNYLHDVTFTHNTVTRSIATFVPCGILAATASITLHGMATADYPAYSGSMDTIEISGNNITGFEQGIVAAAAYEDYVDGAHLSNVSISGNHIETKNYNDYPIVDIGVVVSGAAMQCNSDDSPAHRDSKNCTIDTVSVTDNEITALCGLSVSGLLVTDKVCYPSTGNTAENVTAENNRITQRDRTEAYANTAAGIVTGDVVELLFKLGFNDKDKVRYVGGNSVVGFSEAQNQLLGFTTPKAVFGGLHIDPNESGWDLLSDSNETAMAVKAQVGDLWLYRTTTHSYLLTESSPTCTEKGYTTHTCACGDSYVDTYVNALGHKTELKNNKAATCTEAGYTGDKVCTVCGVTVEKGKSINALGHKWNSGAVTKPATETETGIMTYTCTVCG
ncbi:MAG: PEGA domain-containing protein, partial [Oscillospiraceae bacterium]|nr:PEGA domain-containing protein [Oscillospiraceae bacterium]